MTNMEKEEKTVIFPHALTAHEKVVVRDNDFFYAVCG